MSASLSFNDLPEIAQSAIKQALSRGATDAECTISEGQEFSASVRMGEVETLKEAGSRGAGLRVLIGKRMGSSYTSDLTPEGIRQMVDSAVDLAQLTTEDPQSGLPDASELGSIPGDLKLFSDEVATLAADRKIDAAKRAEAAALAFDPRITNSEGGSFDSNIGGRVFANSRGFAGSYQSTYCSISAVPVATLNGNMERDYQFTVALHVAIERGYGDGGDPSSRWIKTCNPPWKPTLRPPILLGVGDAGIESAAASAAVGRDRQRRS